MVYAALLPTEPVERCRVDGSHMVVPGFLERVNATRVGACFTGRASLSAGTDLTDPRTYIGLVLLGGPRTAEPPCTAPRRYRMMQT